MNYYDRSLDALMHAYGRYNVTFDHGDGIHLYDVNQKEYIDFFSGIGVNSFGYNYPAYVEAMEKQLHRLMHISNYFNTVETIEAAECVKKATKLDKVFFTNSGAESTEGALKLARKYYYQKHGKADSEIISLNHSFHGRTTGSVKLTGNAHYQEAFGPLIEGVKYANINDLESVKALISEKTAAIIVEPVQGEGGVYVCTKEFLTGLRILCDEKGIALILDEVQCGMGRTGTIMTYFQYDILPDILCLAKGIGAGFPMGAFVANKKFAAAMEPGDHGSTYGGNGVEEKETAYIKNASKQAPVFLINSWIEGENIYCSNADDFSAAYEVTSALIRRGKKRILFLYDSETFSAKQKMEGYERALSDAGYPVLGDLKFRTKNEIHHARDLMLAYKNLEFDSVFAVEDGLAVAALKYAKVKGISVPEELSVVGYNNSPLSVSCEPELTSVDSRIEQQCYIAVENIVKVLEGNTEVSHRTIVPCEIVKRCTTDF